MTETTKMSDKYHKDFVLLNECRLFLLKYLQSECIETSEDETIEPVWRELEGPRSIRLFFPHGKHVVRQMVSGIVSPRLCWFVGFFGTKRACQDDAEMQNLTRTVDELDTKLLRELTENQPHIACYITARVTPGPGSEWYNMVVLTSEEAMFTLKNSELHNVAVTIWSPLYYSKVCIHSGFLRNGLLSGDFTVKKTLCLDYTEYLTNNKKYQRYIEPWAEDGEVGVVVSIK